LPRKHFKVVDGDWRTPAAFEFAELLSKANANSQNAISRQFGLQLAIRQGHIEIDSDGTKFGVGGFALESELITFEIKPKVEGFEMGALFEALSTLGVNDEIVNFGNLVRGAGFNEEASSNARLSYLLALEERLASFDARRLLSFNTTSVVYTGPSIRGRPESLSISKSLASGVLRLKCRVLDNERQRLIAALVLMTLRKVRNLIDEFERTTHARLPRDRRSMEKVIGQLSALSAPTSLRIALTETSAPPYPMGTSEFVRECQQFWRTPGLVGISDSRRGSGIVNMAVDAARGFELYALAYFKRKLPRYKKFELLELPYEVVYPSPAAPLRLTIKPDHLLYHEESGTLLILEVKYSLDLAARTHLSQVITYLKYLSFPMPVEKVSGIIVYPGTDFSTAEVRGFDAAVTINQIPVSRDEISADTSSQV